MRSRAFPVVGISLAAMAVGTAFAPIASATPAGTQATVHGFAYLAAPSLPRAGSCVSQRDADGKPVVSQNFEFSLSTFDSWAADDFTLAKTCVAREIDVDGGYLGGSPHAKSFNVTFYHNGTEGVPAGVVKIMRRLAYTESGGTFAITLASPVKLAKGRYWVSVQANMRYGGGGLWGWATNNTVRGTASVWMNPGDGFSTGCTRWTTTTTCIQSGEGGDFSYAIR